MSKLPFPSAVLDQHLAMLGKTGSGKSSKLRLIVEHLIATKKRVCILDPKGDWWGVKLAANGKDPGLPFVLFGDFKEPRATDVPINEHSGKHIAELIASGNRPCVIGMRGWSQGAMTRFWIQFASTLFSVNSGELYVVGDEFHNFAPKQWKGQSDKDTPVGVGLHWANRLLSEGRGLGLIFLIASQRPQKVHNDTLTSCETLIALRVVHAADRAAIKAWIDGNGDPDLGREVLNSLAGLERTDGWVWSPEVKFGPKQLTFPMFSTFDSFAPPQLQKRIKGKGWAKVDLEAVREKLASVIEEAKANDPRELKKENTELKRQLALPRLKEAVEKVVSKIVKVPVLKDGQLARVEKIVGRFEQLVVDMKEKFATSAAAVAKEGEELRRIITPAMTPQQAPAPALQSSRPAAIVPRKVIHTPPQTSPPASAAPPREGLNGPMQRVLDAYAWWSSIGVDQPERGNVALLAGYKHVNSKGLVNSLSSLRTAGLIYGDALTETGRAKANWPESIDTLAKYHERIKAVLDGPQCRLFDAMYAAGGSAARADLCAASGYQHPNSKGFVNSLSRLRVMGLFETPRAGDAVTATKLMYPDGLKR